MFACNPRYIFEQLYGNAQKQLEYVWCINNKTNSLDQFGNVKTVKYNTFLYYYFQMTSKVIVSNLPTPIFLPLRKGQIMVNTWHGGGAYKRVGLSSPRRSSLTNKQEIRGFKTLENKNNFEWERYKAKYNLKDTTYFISSSRSFTEVMSGAQLLPLSSYLNIGMPRNDIFFSDYSEERRRTKEKLGINVNKSVVLYAPTYRGNVKSQVYNLELDIELCLESLNKRWGGEWVFAFRSHVFGESQDVGGEFVVNASDFEEMQQLLCMADVLITDYSSSMWDFALTRKPAFLFTPDLQYYLNDDRGFYTPIDDWPFPYAETNDKLADLIGSFDMISHKIKIESHLKSFGSYEDGNATTKIISIIDQYL